MDIQELPEKAKALGYEITTEVKPSFVGNYTEITATRKSGYRVWATTPEQIYDSITWKNHKPECKANMEQRLREMDEYAEKYPDYCHTCQGWGGQSFTYDPSPAGVSLGSGFMTDWDPCPDCADKLLCPRCRRKFPTGDADDFDREFDFETDSCPTCGWKEGSTEGMPPGPDECGCFYEQERQQEQEYFATIEQWEKEN